MNNASNVWRCKGDPRVVGLSAMPGERCINTLTNIVYCKKGSGNTDWILGSEAYGGGGSDSGNVDGGSPTSNYGGSITIDGGTP